MSRALASLNKSFFERFRYSTIRLRTDIIVSANKTVLLAIPIKPRKKKKKKDWKKRGRDGQEQKRWTRIDKTPV